MTEQALTPATTPMSDNNTTAHHSFTHTATPPTERAASSAASDSITSPAQGSATAASISDGGDGLFKMQPPHNIEMERSLLASLMSIDNAFEQVDSEVAAADFYGERHKHIFEAISHLARVNEPYDTLMVHEYLSRLELLTLAGGESYLMQINQSPANYFNLVTYAKKVRELSVYRQLIKSANNMLNLAYHPKQQSVTDILDVVEADIFRIGESFANGDSKTGPRKVDDVIVSVVEQLNELKGMDGSVTGLDTGFEELNVKTLGLQNSDMIIVAARPSMGKTTFAMNIAQTALNNGKAVAVFSMEMPSESIVMRLLSSWGAIHQGHLRSANMNEGEWANLMSSITWLQDKHLYIDDRNNLSPSEVRATCRRLAKNHPNGLDLIIIDYLQLMKVPGMENNRVGEIGEISRSIKALAREMKCPVIALSQLNRSLENRPNKRPVMSDLRESGQIEQDADLILFIYRDEVYYPDKQNNKGVAEIIIGKQRNGGLGKVPLKFTGEFTRFDNMIGYDIPDDYDEEE